MVGEVIEFLEVILTTTISFMIPVLEMMGVFVVAVGAGVGIYFKKAKKKVSDKLGIDENRNKEVESDEIVVKKKKK